MDPFGIEMGESRADDDGVFFCSFVRFWIATKT